MATRRAPPAAGARDGWDGLSQSQREEAHSYLGAIKNTQAAEQGTIEYLSMPRIRRFGRRVALAWIALMEVAGVVWRRTTDSHRAPGRWWRKVLLLRPLRTFSWWMVIWVLLAGASALVAFDHTVRQATVEFVYGPKPRRATAAAVYEDWDEAAKWLARTVLASAFAALVATLWHDVIISPHTERRIRRRIRRGPMGLLSKTLELNPTKVIELDPPFNTVPRDDLYDEILPGALSRKRDVQIVMAEPGAGKTTALIDLAAVLAKIGLVPILLQMRGESSAETLYRRAEDRFKEQVRPLVRSADEIDRVWRWLCRRQRIAILVDDIDQIGFDGEPGFVMRHMIEEVTSENQTVVVTARPSGVPVGIAASAVTMHALAFETAVDLVAEPRSREPGATAPSNPSRKRIERWVREGDLHEAPLYLEALAELTSVGVPLDLPEDPLRWTQRERPGRWRSLSEKRRQWNPKWVRYLLLDSFYAGMGDGSVRRALAIDAHDRQKSIEALAGAALGMLGAAALQARAEALVGGKPVEGSEIAAELNVKKPRRGELADFISSDDRRDLDSGRDGQLAERPARRKWVSPHEAIDTGNRLRILEYDFKGKPQFRHRITQAFMAGRRLAELGRMEREKGERPQSERERSNNGQIESVTSFDDWVDVLMDSHHPEKLTAHMALMFAAVHADKRFVEDDDPNGDGLAERIVDRLIEGAQARSPGAYARAVLVSVASGAAGTVVTAAGATVETGAGEASEPDPAKDLDPMGYGDPHERNDPDDRLQKLVTAAEIVTLLKRDERSSASEDSSSASNDPAASRFDRKAQYILRLVRETRGAMQWTKFQALPAVAWLGTDEAWATIWEHFTSDPDYMVRRRASAQLAENAPGAYRALGKRIEGRVVHAAYRAKMGRPLERADDRISPDGHSPGRAPVSPEAMWGWDGVSAFRALGWVLPPIASGLGEELQAEYGYESDPNWSGRDGSRSSEADTREVASDELRRAREQLESFVALAFNGNNHRLQETVAQGFKADATRHAKKLEAPGEVAGNRRLVADVALPRAGSWYARMLLYQALALYAIAGKSVDDTLDVLAYRLQATRERHPFSRRAAKLSRAAVQRARLHSKHWEAFIWDDATEEGGRVPSVLTHVAAALVGDVAVLVDLKDGSPEDRQGNFGAMEELPYCLSRSRNRYEILGAGCVPQCRWGLCPYHAASPDEPEEHRGVSRVFCRGERRRVRWRPRPASWQRRIRRRRLRQFWEQMEYKARR
jgi:hypothetical protein